MRTAIASRDPLHLREEAERHSTLEILASKLGKSRTVLRAARTWRWYAKSLRSLGAECFQERLFELSYNTKSVTRIPISP